MSSQVLGIAHLDLVCCHLGRSQGPTELRMLDSIATERPTPLCIRRSKPHAQHVHRKIGALFRLLEYVQGVLHRLRILHLQRSFHALIATGHCLACSPWDVLRQRRCGWVRVLLAAGGERCSLLSDYDSSEEYVVVLEFQKGC